MNIIIAQTAAHYTEGRGLIEAYQVELNRDLCFQGFAAELDSLAEMYGPPAGSLLLGYQAEDAIACVGLRNLEPGICEMKRMYVSPEFRGRGFGKALLSAFLVEAKKLEYRAVRLDTLKELQRALHLYRDAGFEEIPAYRHNPSPDVIYLELALADVQSAQD